NVAVKWWLLTLAGPFGLAYMLYLRNNAVSSRPVGPSTTTARPTPASAPQTLLSRVDLLEQRVAVLQAIVDDLRAGRVTTPDRAASPASEPTPTPTPTPRPVPPQPTREPAPAA